MAIRELTPAEQAKRDKGLCISYRCTKKHLKKGRICWACQKKAHIKKDPVKYAYQVLKGNAKRRGKDFTLTLDYFRLLTEKTDYMRKKGITCKSLHIDRVDETKGYSNENIQVISLRQNVQKYHRFRAGDTSSMETGPAPF